MAIDKKLDLIKDYMVISNRLKDNTLTDKERTELTIKQVELCSLINKDDDKEEDSKQDNTQSSTSPYSNLTIEEKLDLYLQGKGHLLPQDGFGKGTYGGRVLPTEEEVRIGMYKDRSLYEFKKFTCGIYRFYSVNLPFDFNYIGYSQYIEYALHAQFCRWRSEKNNPDKQRQRKGYIAKSLRYMLDTYPDNIRFEIIEEVPYSLLSAACYNQRKKYNCLWQYKIVNNKGQGFNPAKLEAGEYNF